jgi:hypothetical protein
MTNFPVNKMPTGPVNFMDQEQTENVNSSAVGDRAVSLAAGEGVAPTQTREASRIGDKSAVLQSQPPVQSTQENYVREALAQGSVDLETLSAAVAMAPEKAEVRQELEDYFIEVGRLEKDANYTPTDLRYVTNTLIAEQLFRDRISEVESDTGFVGRVGDWVDRYMLRQIPIGMVEDLTKRRERKGEELLQAALTMNPKQYKEFISNYIDELSDEGFFLSDNIYALQDGFEEATNAGYDPFGNVIAGLAAFEAIGIAKPLVRSVRSLGKADSVIGRVAALEGQEIAAEVAEKAIEASEGLDPHILTKAGPEAFDEGTAVVRPQSAKVLEIAETNTLWSKIRELDKKGVFGRAATPEETLVAGRKIVDDYKKRVTNTFNNFSVIQDIAGNSIVRTDFGNIKNGTPYKRLGDAEKAASKSVPEAYAAPVDPDDASKGFVVRVDKRIDVTGLADEFDTNAIEYGAIRENFARVFGSNAALDDEYLTALANMAESGQTAIKEAARTYEKALKTTPRDSKVAIVRVFKELRDGQDAATKMGYTREEFKQKFKEFHPKGLAPTEKDMEAYDALTQFEDAGWLMRANESLARYVKNDYWAIEVDDGRTIARKAKEVPEDTWVYNVSTGVNDRYSNLDVPVWRLDQPRRDGVEYVSNPKSVKVLDHADVMGFNAGGRRVNPKANYFVTFDGDRPRAVMTTFTEKQARIAVDQLNKLRAKVRELGGDINKIKSSEELDDVVRANNDWNPSITTFDEFASLVKDRGWDLTKKISHKQRNGEIVDETADSFHKGEKWDNYVRVQLHRYNDTLMDFGGGESYNVDPVSAILGEFANAATHYTHRAYTYKASASWVKRAARKGSGVKLSDSFAKDDYLNQVQHAEITGSDSVARRMRHQRAVIRRRLKMSGPVQQRFEAFGQEVAEFVSDATKGRIQPHSLDPSDNLLKLGFQSAFGFFNVSQFVMQSFHATTIMAISPKQGARAAVSAIPLRMALNATNPATQKLAVNRLAKVIGETEETAAELVEYIRSSGRDIVDGDAIELGTGPSYGISGWQENSYLPSSVSNVLQKATNGGQALLDFGLQPFRQGERLARLTGMTTAFFEYKAKYPKSSALSDEGRRWITTREQNLTFNMTASARPMFQEGVMKVPTQWLSYSFRAMETMVLGRGFTPAERARMAAALLPFYGMTGMGLGSAAEWASEKLGLEDPELFIGLKYGFLDYLISEITPVETALATRLAPITAFTDLWNSIVGGEKSFIQVIGGPSGDITSGVLGQFLEVGNELWNGHTVSLTEDSLALLRQPSGLDNIAKGIGILNNGMYRSKTGTILPVEMKPSDALISFMGFSPLEVSEFYSQKSGQFNSDKKLRAFTKQMRKDYQLAMQLWREDPDKGTKMFQEIHTKVALSGFSMAQQQKIRQGLAKDVSYQEVYYIIQNLIERDRNNTALVVEQLLGEKTQ